MTEGAAVAASFLYLASASPRRRQLLEQIGVPYQLLKVDVPEVRAPNESPLAYVARLSQQKAEAGLAHILHTDQPLAAVLGADTIGILDAQVLEKPRDFVDFQQMLGAMSGRTHQVVTALTLTDCARSITRVVTTEVRLRQLDADTLARYWQTGEPWDKAGGYGIQGMGAVLVEAINGSYSNVVGLPLETLAEMCREFACPVWQRPLDSSFSAPVSL